MSGADRHDLAGGALLGLADQFGQRRAKLGRVDNIASDLAPTAAVLSANVCGCPLMRAIAVFGVWC
ncbi:hypothetical protein H1S04_10245 [Paracoccus sp. S1E-3]|nr:hypothetical protein [Paracoccus sp. S1E-3]